MVKVLQFDSQFIQEHIDELIHLEDYVPEVSFIVYNKHNEREDFLKSKNLLETMHEMFFNIFFFFFRNITGENAYDKAYAVRDKNIEKDLELK